MKLKRLTLITPPPLDTLIYGDLKFEGVDSVTPPLNLLSLAAYIRPFGFVPAIVDGYANRFETAELLNKVADTAPDIVCITSTSPLFLSAVEIAREIKKRFQDIIIIAGGPHITALPEEVLVYEYFDIAVIGEGEVTLLEVLESLNNGRPLDKVNGIALRTQGVVIRTAPRDRMPNLDVLPLPAWDLLPSLGPPYQTSIVGTKKNKSTPIITSRGCPGRCTFCDTSTFGRSYRFFSAKYVLSMIQHLMENYGIDDYLIYDDTFCTDKNRLEEICRGIIDRRWRITWQCCARIEQVNYELLKLMKKAGCWEIEYGIESGDRSILKKMRKGVNLEKARKIIKMTHNLGIEARGNFIFGNIGETRESLEKTIRFILSTDLDYVQQSFLTPYPGSEVYKIAGENGAFDSDLRKMSNLTINFIPHGLSKNILKQYSRRLFIKFYLRPRIILRILKSIRNFEGIRRILTSFTVFMKHVTNYQGKRA
ncbi:radical SAM protein [Desulfococcaceae bacterium HSG7]|nr:radical SAM protein [Desulfococcaceae bacterium HSG7]